ncbi:MAG: hypothetical protein AAGB02_02440 [Pseudomonadota bacterium]
MSIAEMTILAMSGAVMIIAAIAVIVVARNLFFGGSSQAPAEPRADYDGDDG